MSDYYYEKRNNILYEIIWDKNSSFIEFRDKCDSISTMLTWEKNYGSSDTNLYVKPSAFLEEKLKAHCSGGDLLHAISTGYVYGLIINRDNPEDIFVESLEDDFRLYIGNENHFEKIRAGVEDLPDYMVESLCNKVALFGGAIDRILQPDMLLLPVYTLPDGSEYSTEPYPDEQNTQCGYIYVEDWKKTGLSKAALYDRMVNKVRDYDAWSKNLSAEIYFYNLSKEDYEHPVSDGVIFDCGNLIDSLIDRGAASLGEYEDLYACLDDNVGIFPSADSQEQYVVDRLKEDISSALEKFNLHCNAFSLNSVVKELVRESQTEREKYEEDLEL